MPTVASGQRAAASLFTRRGCRIRRAATQTLNNATLTTISYDTEDEDTDALFPSSGTTITIPFAGMWIPVLVLSIPIAGGTRNFASINISGGGTGIPPILRESFDAGESIVTVTAQLPLAANATITTDAFQNSGSNTTMTAFFCCYRTGV